MVWVQSRLKERNHGISCSCFIEGFLCCTDSQDCGTPVLSKNMHGDLSGNPRVRPEDLIPPTNFVGASVMICMRPTGFLPHGLTYGVEKKKGKLRQCS
jgi:hypothetical protein